MVDALTQRVPTDSQESRVARLCRVRRPGFLAFVLVFGPGAVALSRPHYTIEPLAEPAPKDEVSKEILALLEPVGLRIVDRKKAPYLDVWLVRRLAVEEPTQQTGVLYGHIPEGSVLGVLRLHARQSDFRGDRLPAGVFTLRNAIQPQDGEHLGVSESRDFVLLAPAKVDTSPDPLRTRDIVKLSVRASGTKHPSMLYLIRLAGEPKGLPRIVEQEDLEYQILDCEVRNLPIAKREPTADGAAQSPETTSGDADSAAKPVRLSIVIEGEASEL